jgi:hypothetical protein
LDVIPRILECTVKSRTSRHGIPLSTPDLTTTGWKGQAA